MMKPLQVMPLDESFNLVSGPLDYESLQWNRKYYETGDFSMSVLSTDYDPSWAYIYTPFRPEMGIIQKVEFSDTSHTPDGKDTVTVSGFFMDWVLDRLVFLVEQTEQEKVIVPKPTRPSNSAPKPNLKQDADGNLYMEYNEGTSSHHYNSVETGECIWPDQIEGEETWTDVPLGAGDGMSEQRYPVRDAQGNVTGDFGSGWYNAKYNYYSSDDGKLHVVGDGGEEAIYDLVGDGTNAVIYKDSDGSYKWVWGVVEEGEESAKDRYRREVEEWEVQTKSLQVDDDGNYFYYRTVKGPWQLRTDINDVTTPQDNVQWVIKMAQKVFGNNFFYDEPDFSGETKILSPSLTRIGDFFRQELKTIEAGLRIFYSFKSNQMIFQVWRGLDRTQDENSPAIDDAVEQDVPAMLMAANEISTMSAATASLPSGYVELEYIESTGTQYINTGFIPNQNTRAVLDIESDEAIPECHVFSDKWGSLYDYSASVDDSNYRNLCYVLHDFDEPEWDNDGHPVVEEVIGEYLTEILGYRVKYTKQRSQWVVRLEDDYEDRETWLDKRDEKPEQDQDWPRDMQEEMPDVSGVTKESYDRFKTSLQNEGRAYLEENYPIVKNLDTGTLDMSEYLTGFDLGDKVDMEVSTLGLKETARIIEVDEVHESGRSEVHLVMGEEMVTSTKKARLS